MEETRLRIEGMTCGGCARTVQQALAAVPGVAAAAVDLPAAEARVSWAGDGSVDVPALRKAVSDAGYKARPSFVSNPSPDAAIASGSVWDRTLFVGLPVMLAMMIAEWATPLGHAAWYGWASLALALPVQVLLGIPFYRGAWRQLHHNRLTMDTLVALGSTAAFGLSLYGLLRPHALHHLYFMEAVSILSLVGLGHWLEARIARKANATVRSLLALAPETARRIGPGGTEESVAVSAVRPGDLLLLKPGDRVPLDGAVVDHSGAVDESMLTGEALPAEKSPGSPVYAGTLNLNRRLIVRAGSGGAETALARIVRVVERAQASRADVERLVDKVSALFVLGVVSLAMITAMIWGLLTSAGWEAAFVHAISVLVIACPCAMGLATPAALLASGNVAARGGVLFRDAAALEKCGRIDTLLFDKTGTLTEALPAVREVEFHGMAESEFAALARALAEPSAHPLSRGLAAHFAAAARIALQDWREERGAGVAAQYQGRTARLGSPAWLIASGVAFPDDSVPRLGGTLALALGSTFIGLVSFDNRPRPEAGRVIHALAARGIRIHLVSGDAPAAALALAESVGIPKGNVFSEIRPERKAEIVAQLQKEGRKVAFVGDGINDAPALAQADLGIAVVSASDIARESADVVLLRRDLEAIPEILDLSAATLRTIKQNLFWAFVYNAAAVPLAMAGLVPPVFSALAMGLSDVFVMGNALRLSRWKARKAS